VIVLDTNVLSELMRTSPDQAVLGWLDSLPVAEIATTAITAAELFHGVARLPDCPTDVGGRRCPKRSTP